MLEDQVDPERYLELIAERPVSFSYLKFPYYRKREFGPGAFYRVGPLARLNVATRMPTPLAQGEFEAFRRLGNGRPVHGDFHYHYARLIETLACIELAESILRDDRILSSDIQSHAGRNQAEGIGCSEAPRGTLFHHYWTHVDGEVIGHWSEIEARVSEAVGRIRALLAARAGGAGRPAIATNPKFKP